ncbi:MAG: riboflavin synthase [Bacteroidetes bacterium]|nr:riboflavin synthase [Bacteroidota bacterium]
MFTGIIQEIGIVDAVVRKSGGVRLAIRADASAQEIKVDDSVAINGVCQTVISRRESSFEVEAVEETLRKTTIGSLRVSDRVNLELALQMGDRLGGHLVQGHVDCVGHVESVEKRPMSWLVRVSFPRGFSRYVVPVGSIAVDGVSLTVAAVEGSAFIVSVIPHTLEKTTLSDVRAGTAVNLEFDLVGKYIERMVLKGDEKGGGISKEKVAAWGFGT